ncbi:hypothetical protein [Deinococcus deserti]|uniref:Uncharacterized protein n=1 Tax=Deinococcus deserti (strain DSM 17065 / CIP 109153 / LMG 22923 / VCD115) TaxID=546414 RepID=C1CUQ8_DEIDV|nr:hypothetical protein [Deinococcus deserti]ACO45925.1 conserved hypothetical protein, precursor [Deinococcus deserti VCD115]
MKDRSPLPLQWHTRLIALPGVLTLLSVLAVILGTPMSTVDASQRMTAGSVSPGMPELRPAPQPVPATPLPASPPPEPWRLSREQHTRIQIRPAPVSWQPRPDLITWGRQQTDGG